MCPQSSAAEDRPCPSASNSVARKGWRKPEGAVVVARPSKWGNPYRVGINVETKSQAVAQFADMLSHAPEMRQAIRNELRGKDLCCWCGPGPCHADVLLEIANGPLTCSE